MVELLVVIAIVALLAFVVAPSLSGDDREAEFRSLVNRLAQDMRRARYEAISSREDRVIFIAADGLSYSLGVAIPGNVGTSPIKAPEYAASGVEITGALEVAAEPGTGYLPPGQLPAEIRYLGTNAVQARVGAGAGAVLPDPNAATVFVQTVDGKHQARLVTFEATAYTRIYWRW